MELETLRSRVRRITTTQSQLTFMILKASVPFMVAGLSAIQILFIGNYLKFVVVFMELKI